MPLEYDNIKDELTRQIIAQKIIYKFRNFLYSINKDIRQQFFRISREYFDNECQNNTTNTTTEKERLQLLLNHWDWNSFDTSSRDWWFNLSFNHSKSLTLLTLIQLWIDDVQIFDSETFETATDGLR
jgi:hypothetical protein